MTKYINKTQPTSISAVDFINQNAKEDFKEDLHTLLKFFNKVTGYKPVIWGKVVGYGNYHYKSISSEGDWYLCGFAPRASTIALYIMGQIENKEELYKKHMTASLLRDFAQLTNRT